MKITFDWKNFVNEKPELGRKIIFKNCMSKGELIIGEYKGEFTNDFKEGEKEHAVVGGKLNLSSLSKKNTQTFLFSDDVKCNEWDYYNSEWV